MGRVRTDAVSFTNISATTSAFTLKGGLYMFICKATGWGTVKLQMLAGDGTTYVDVPSSSLTADGALTVQIPGGTYKVNIATATAVYADLRAIARDI